MKLELIDTKKKIEIICSLAYVTIFGFMLLSSTKWLFAAKIYIWAVAGPALLISIIVLIKALKSIITETDDQADNINLKELQYIVYLLGFVSLIYLLGFQIAASIFTFLYVKIVGKFSWKASVVVTVIIYIGILIFENIFNFRWPGGVLIKLFKL